LLAALPSILIPAGRGSATSDKLGDLLPLRKLGRTGESVTMLGVGGYHVGYGRFLTPKYRGCLRG